MAAQYQAIPLPIRPENPSPLEMAIYLYEKKCAEFHCKKRATKVASLTPAQQQKHAEAQALDWSHLRMLKASLMAHTTQEINKKSLQDYRNAAKNELSPFDLAKEDHHPTDILERNLAADGEVKPSHRHTAHHIIMGKGRWLKENMALARFNLHLHGIGINDPLNGVWLVHNRVDHDVWSSEFKDGDTKKPRHWATPDSPVHLPIHTKNYETWITVHFMSDYIPEDVFVDRLDNIKIRLKTGTYPSKIEEKYDENWDGLS